MADRHAAGQAERRGAVGDHLDRQRTHLAAVVQVDVDAAAVARRDREDAVELRLRVAVDADRVEPADRFGAFAHGELEQLERAGADRHAALREGDQLDRDRVAVALAHRLQAVQVGEAQLGADVDVAAHVRGAAGEQAAHQPRALQLGREGEPAQHAALVLDAIEQRRPRAVRLPRRAPQRLVEVRVRVDEAGQDQAAARIDRVGAAEARIGDARAGAGVVDAGAGCAPFRRRGVDGVGVDEGGDAAVADQHVGNAAAPEAAAVQQQVGHADPGVIGPWRRAASGQPDLVHRRHRSPDVTPARSSPSCRTPCGRAPR